MKLSLIVVPVLVVALASAACTSGAADSSSGGEPAPAPTQRSNDGIGSGPVSSDDDGLDDFVGIAAEVDGQELELVDEAQGAFDSQHGKMILSSSNAKTKSVERRGIVIVLRGVSAGVYEVEDSAAVVNYVEGDKTFVASTGQVTVKSNGKAGRIEGTYRAFLGTGGPDSVTRTISSGAFSLPSVDLSGKL